MIDTQGAEYIWPCGHIWPFRFRDVGRDWCPDCLTENPSPDNAQPIQRYADLLARKVMVA